MIDNKIIKRGVVVVALGVLAVTFIIIYSDLQEITEKIQQINLRYLPFIFLLIPLNYCIKCIRYHYYLRLARLSIRRKDEIYSLMAASVMVITPGKLGEVLLRGYLLKKEGYNVSTLTICAMAIADRLTEGLAMVVLALLTISGFSKEIKPEAVYLAAAVLLFVIFILQEKSLCLKVLRLGENIPFAKKTVMLCAQAYSQTYVIFKAIPIIISTLLGMVSWTCEAGVIYLSLFALGEDLAFGQILFSVSLSGLLGAVSMIPGGVGIADGTLLGLLTWCGLKKASAGTVTVISRFSTMWLGIFIGVILLLKNRTALSGLLKE